MTSPQYQIMAMWSHPRSMSTATERIMRERGDFTCFHEPFMYYYYVHRGVKELPHFDIDPDTPASFEDVMAMLREAAREGPVFFKDMSYYVVPDMFSMPALAHELTHVFLIRDPRKSILSYHKLDPDLEQDEIGLEAQWRHFEWLRGETGRDAIVLEAESIQEDPRGIMAAFWNKAGLPHRESAFEWSGDETPEDWKQVEGWHGSVSSSSGIRQTQREGDDVLNEKFAAAARAAPKLKDYLAHHWPAYESMKRLAINA